MRKFFHLSSCNTCARIMSETHLEGFELQDLKEENISAEELDFAKEKVGSYEELFNKRAQKYRLEKLNEKNLSEAEWREAILSEPTFLKRPLLVDGDVILAGNAKKTVAAMKEQTKG